MSKRLLEIADMVDTKNIYDVGCDHALLDIYLAKEKNINCIAIDISEINIKRAKKNILKNNLNIKAIVNDGLENINVLPDSTIILSGLGTRTILNILKGNDCENIIVQSNNNLFDLRKSMNEQGYVIEKESVLYDKKYYVTIKFKKGNIKYNEKQLYLGPILLNNSNINYYKHLKNACFKINDKMDEDKKQLFNRINKYINEKIQENS